MLNLNSRSHDKNEKRHGKRSMRHFSTTMKYRYQYFIISSRNRLRSCTFASINLAVIKADLHERAFRPNGNRASEGEQHSLENLNGSKAASSFHLDFRYSLWLITQLSFGLAE